MKTKKLFLLTAALLLFALCAAVNVYADEAVSSVRVSGHSPEGLYSTMNTSTVRGAYVTYPAPDSEGERAFGITPTLQKYENSGWTDYTNNAKNIDGTIYESDGTTIAKNVTIKNDVTDYPLTVAGKTVTRDNAGDILGDGVFAYDAQSKTLTVNGDCTSSNILIYNSGVDDLIINVTQNSTLTENGYNPAIVCTRNTTITGNGKLTIDAGGRSGISLLANKAVTIENADLNITNSYCGITSVYENGSLVIKGSHISADSTNGAICNFGGITLDDCYIASPKDAENSGGTIYESDGTTKAAEVEIKAKEYKLIIAGMDVTVQNAHDVLGNGVFSYDAKTKTLTVDGDCSYNVAGVPVIYNSGIEGLTILVAGDSSLTHRNGAVMDSNVDNMTITSAEGHVLKLKGSSGIMGSNTMNIVNANIEVNDSSYGIICSFTKTKSTLNIKNSRVVLNTNGTTSSSGAIRRYLNLTLDGCVMASPAGAVYNDRCLYGADGETIARKAFITNGDVNFDGKTNNVDAALTLKYINEDKPFFTDSDQNTKAVQTADTDGSGAVDMLDAVKIMQLMPPAVG